MKLSKKMGISTIAVYFCICTVINFVKFLPETITEIGTYSANIYQTVLFLALTLVWAFIGAIVSNFFVIIFLVMTSLATRRVKKNSLSKVDVKKYFGYYRDILSDYSPAVLSYVDDLTVEPKKDIVATLLSLKLKKKIDIAGGNIKILDKNSEGLERNEKYILENGVENCNEFVFESLVKDDAKDKGLIKDGKMFTKKGIIIFICIILAVVCFDIFYISSFGTVTGGVKGIQAVFIVGGGIFLAFSPVALIVYGITYISKSLSNNARTKKGEEVNEKLEGLRNYLKDYSNLNEKEENSITLWEEYLIYSVIFKQNTEIVDKLYK